MAVSVLCLFLAVRGLVCGLCLRRFLVILTCFLRISKKEGRDQESIQSSTTPDPGYQWESDNVTIDITNESRVVSLFTAGDHKTSTNRRA